MATEKQLLEAVKAFERRGFARAQRDNLDSRRIITRLSRSYHEQGLAFDVAFKEVGGVPKFLTFTFHEPKSASFIFFSYDAKGKRYFVRKIFSRMVEFLAAHELTDAVLALIQSETFE